MIASLGDDIVVVVGSAFFVVIGTIVVRWRHRIAPHAKPSSLFESVDDRAGFLRFWGYGAVILGSVSLTVGIVELMRRV